MPHRKAIIVADAHLGPHDPETTRRFHRFVAEVPSPDDLLLINGDLFEFWFEYRRAIPTHTFRTLAELRAAALRGTRLVLVGGNHDRWSRDFWEQEIGAAFHRDSCELELGGLHSFVSHGDGLAEQRRGSRILHAITRSRLTEAVFRAIHPDVGIALVNRLAPHIAEERLAAGDAERVARFQEQFAARLFSRRPALELVVMAHSHVARLTEPEAGRYFLNPGAFLGAGSYAEVSAGKIKLLTYNTL